MGAVLPKFYNYLWLSIICLLINMCVFCTVIIADSTADVNSFLDSSETDDYDFNRDVPDEYNATIQNFALSTGGAFVPFFSLVSLALLGGSLPALLTVFTGVIIGIISAVQVFLLSIIILNLAPKVFGSGWDV